MPADQLTADECDELVKALQQDAAILPTGSKRESLLRLAEGYRAILNFGHTFGHALEAETEYARYLHGEAVGFGMRAATHLAEATGRLAAGDSAAIQQTVKNYGPIPAANGISPDRLAARLTRDKKTIQGTVHFVLPNKIGEVAVVSGIDERLVLQSIETALT